MNPSDLKTPMMKFSDLKTPFPEKTVEWRIGQSGVKGNGQVWARCLAYIQARAIMDRLDEVCGPENWKASYRFEPSGVMCILAIKVGDEWIAKEDGAEQTDIEAFKGGISSALKRAAVLWGIGRYLYDLESGWAEIVEQGAPNATFAQTSKEKKIFYWVPPKLPLWAIPIDERPAADPLARARVKPGQPSQHDGIQHNDWTFPSGTLIKKKPSACSTEQLHAMRAATKTKYPDGNYPANIQEAMDHAAHELYVRDVEPQ